MSKVSNIVMMINLLSKGRKYSIKELSNLLEVTPRMIRIYKEELDKCGIYIDTIRGPYGGYVLNQNIKLPEIEFDVSDYDILNEYIKKEKDECKKESLINLRDKVKGVYISNKLEYKDKDTISKYNLFMKAIKERRKVKILYYSFEKGENERVIEPVEMFLFKSEWYCTAYCELRCDIRHFELRRVLKCEVLDEKF